MMVRFDPLRTFLLSKFEADEQPVIIPGPDDRNAPPGKFIMLSMIGGSGLNTEYLFDGVGWQVLVAGEQSNYSSAEDLAFRIDAYLLNIHSQIIGDKWVTGVVRQGGQPTPLPTMDSADRHRFTCNYIIDTQSAVA